MANGVHPYNGADIGIPNRHVGVENLNSARAKIPAPVALYRYKSAATSLGSLATYFVPILPSAYCFNSTDKMTQLTNNPVSFGERYAILNLDWMTVLVNAAKDTPEGQAFISSCSRWNDAVHQKSPRPLTIFSTLSFERGQPEVQDNTPFARLIAPFGTFEHNSDEVKVASQFHTDENDVILNKTRWSATMGNSIEQILKAQRIDTVIIVSRILLALDRANIWL